MMLILFCIICIIQNKEIISLNSGWKFHEFNSQLWYPAYIPSTVHLDLLNNRLIEDPYLEDNLLKMYELELYDWEYAMTFTLKTIPKQQVQELVFEGLDTHADVYLNNQLILQANNMHRTWRVRVQNLQLSNELKIHFKSAAIHDLQAQLIDAPLNLPFNYTYSRKSAYHYGWDWGPRLVTCGIWKSVSLEMLDEGRIDQFYAKTLEINGNEITVEIIVDLFIIQPENYQLKIIIAGEIHNEEIINQFPNNQFTNTYKYILKGVEAWWPRGQGEQKLYQIQCTLLRNQQMIDIKSIKSGFRIAKWIQEKDSFEGTTFKLNLNGRDIYLKGANYIPPDMFMPRAEKNPIVYEKIMQDSINGGYNGLRLWGGGQFELDIFYELADKYGIVIWHDLMFACAMYPGNKEFIENVEQELRDNINRLRHHPSIIMWNGNNEVGIGWREWGWKKNRNQEEIDTLQYWYDQLFHNAIPKVLQQIHPDIFYWPTSPSSSQNDLNEMKSGDVHYWSVWASAEPIESYKTYIGRFNSEYGMQAMIDVSNFKKILSKSYDLQMDSPNFQLHERHPIGIPLLQKYLQNYTKNATNFRQLTYNTQIIQAYALSTAIQSLRSAKPFNMGTFYWQINDVWPVISWSTVDYYGCWKAGHYAVKQHHSDPIIMATENNNTLKVYIINDLSQTFSGNVTVQQMLYSGYQVKQWKINYINITNEKAKILINHYIEDYNSTYQNTYLILRFDCDQLNCNYFGTYNFGKPKQYNLLKPNIQYAYYGNNQYIFKTQFYAKWVYLYNEEQCVQTSDNFFDLIPGIPKNITIKNSFKILSLYDI